MSYSNRILGWSGKVALSETVIVKGEKGDPGIGYKLTSDGNDDLQNKKVCNLDTPDDHKIDDFFFSNKVFDDDYNTRIRDLKSAVNKEYLNDKFLKKSGNYFDARQMVIKSTEPYYDGLYDNNTSVSKAYVDAENSKQDIAIADKTSKAYVDTENGKQNIAIADKTNKSCCNADSVLLEHIDGRKEALREVSVKLNQGLDEKLSIHGGNSMTVDLDMGNNKIINLKPPTPKYNAASKEYVDIEILKVGGGALLLNGSHVQILS